MFYQNRFTERARQALTFAQEAAASFGHSYIGSEHLLLGLLREGGGPAAKALTAAGVTDEALVHQIEELSGRGTPDSTAPQGMTPRTKRIVELSVQSANEMGTGYVGTEHLLLGILREGQNVALTALANLKITPEILVRKLNEALGGAQDGVSAETGASAGGADSKDALAQFGRDLTAAAKEGKLDPVIGRTKDRFRRCPGDAEGQAYHLARSDRHDRRHQVPRRVRGAHQEGHRRADRQEGHHPVHR